MSIYRITDGGSFGPLVTEVTAFSPIKLLFFFLFWSMRSCHLSSCLYSSPVTILLSIFIFILVEKNTKSIGVSNSTWVCWLNQGGRHGKVPEDVAGTKNGDTDLPFAHPLWALGGAGVPKTKTWRIGGFCSPLWLILMLCWSPAKHEKHLKTAY